MKIIGKIAACLSFTLLAACGGGGGDPGGSGNSSGEGGTSVNAIVNVQTFKGEGQGAAPVNSFSSSELDAHVKATVKDRAGNPIPGTVVTFSQEGSALLEFIPESATALTNKDGVAEVDVKAKDAQALGATQIVATVKVVDRTGQEKVATGRQSVSVSPTVVADPQAAAAAINFSKANPSDSSIVIAGSGGNGRSETALLTFTVVDGQGSPLKGVVVDFNVVPAGSVNLLTTQGTTNSAGEVTVSVSSKENPVSVIVNARVRERNISTQSDTLTVTTDIATQRGFDLSASKYNMDFDLSGDSSTINVMVVDRNGNPVADGLAVVAQADYGRVGTSGRGGCTTVNGKCSVQYEVQNPRPLDGVPVNVLFSTQTGQGERITDSLRLWVTSVGWLDFYADRNSTTPITAPINLSLVDAKTCKFSGFVLWLGTEKGFPAPAGTVITARSRSELANPAVVAGSPTLDSPGIRNLVEFSATGKPDNPAGVDNWVVQFTAGPSKTVYAVNLAVSVPACPKVD